MPQFCTPVLTKLGKCAEELARVVAKGQKEEGPEHRAVQAGRTTLHTNHSIFAVGSGCLMHSFQALFAGTSQVKESGDPAHETTL